MNVGRVFVLFWCMAARRRHDFKALEWEAKFKTATTGVRHVLDHIIPIDHPCVCGLNVPWNIQIIDESRNAKKGNKLHPAFQSEMFTDPQQLGIL